MAIFFCLTGLCAVGWFVWQRQRTILSELRLRISVVDHQLAELNAEKLTREMAELDAKAVHEAELEEQTKRFDKAYDKLEHERGILEVECNLRKEYAYVCRNCKQADPTVQLARERSLRSVTSGPKR